MLSEEVLVLFGVEGGASPGKQLHRLWVTAGMLRQGHQVSLKSGCPTRILTPERFPPTTGMQYP